SAICAIDAALSDISDGLMGEIPPHLKDAHYGGAQKLGHGTNYKYPHSYPNHYVKQQYLPDTLLGRTYYKYGESKLEQQTKAYWDEVKKK
ncbi:MAG: AAA family ATPase, partial [Clostridia bacterium]|nr:AAA family ATPase [Clostridia bacterium]